VGDGPPAGSREAGDYPVFAQRRKDVDPCISR